MNPDLIDKFAQFGIVGAVCFLLIKELFSYLKFKRQDEHEMETIKGAMNEVLSHVVLPILNKQTEILQELVIVQRMKNNHGSGD